MKDFNGKTHKIAPLKIKKLHPKAIMPEYMTAGSVAFDVCSYKNVTISRLDGVKLVGIGLAVEIPIGYELEVRQRSGLSLLYPNYIANAPGTIDWDYRGELKIAIINRSSVPWNITTGDRIAQMILREVTIAVFKEVNELSNTKRRDGGYGHTGI